LRHKRLRSWAKRFSTSKHFTSVATPECRKKGQFNRYLFLQICSAANVQTGLELITFLTKYFMSPHLAIFGTGPQAPNVVRASNLRARTWCLRAPCW